MTDTPKPAPATPAATPLAALTRIQVEGLCAGAVREHVDGRLVVDYAVLTELINAALQPAAAQPQRESEQPEQALREALLQILDMDGDWEERERALRAALSPQTDSQGEE